MEVQRNEVAHLRNHRVVKEVVELVHNRQVIMVLVLKTKIVLPRSQQVVQVVKAVNSLTNQVIREEKIQQISHLVVTLAVPVVVVVPPINPVVMAAAAHPLDNPAALVEVVLLLINPVVMVAGSSGGSGSSSNQSGGYGGSGSVVILWTIR